MTISRLLACLCLCAVAPALMAGDSVDYRRFIPDVHGTMRVVYELSTMDGNSRFMVRNARLSASGTPLPMIGYFMQVDFSDRGKTTLLDAYLKLSPMTNLSVIAGQSRVPFSVSASRQPHNYYFINRSFIGKYAGNLRSVGVKAGYTVQDTRLYVEGGIFNGTSRTDHTQWNSAITYGIKANITLPGGFKPEVGFMSRQYGDPSQGARFNQFDASLGWKLGHWTAEAEFLMAHCTAQFPTSYQYSVFVNYDIPVNRGIVDNLAVAARFDGSTDASDGFYDADGRLTVVYPERQRITAGLTTSYRRGDIHFDMRLNYEQYFYRSNSNPGPSDNNKLSAAMILYF